MSGHEFIRFGPEWRKQVVRMPKAHIISIFNEIELDMSMTAKKMVDKIIQNKSIYK